MTDPLYKQMTAFLLGQGIEEMEHTGKTYLGHLIAVHRMMEELGCSTDACRAGLFHSIYGTEAFQRFQLPLERRAEIRDLIGERTRAGLKAAGSPRPTWWAQARRHGGEIAARASTDREGANRARSRGTDQSWQDGPIQRSSTRTRIHKFCSVRRGRK